jgi:hypothetical protein
MEAMLGISLNSHPYLNLKSFVFLVIVYTLSSTELRDKGRTDSAWK